MKRFISFICSLSILLTIQIGIVKSYAEESSVKSKASSYAFDLPDIVKIDKAAEKNYIKRLPYQETDLYSFVFQNADGTNTLQMYDFPVKFYKNGKIVDISTDIVKGSNGNYISAQSEINVTFPSQISEGISLSYNNLLIKMKPSFSTNINSPILSTDKKRVTYQLDQNTSLDYSLTYTGIKEDIVVNEYTGQTEFEFILYTNGLILSEKNGTYNLVDKNGDIQVFIGDIIIFSSDEKNNAFGNLHYQTIQHAQSYRITVCVDDDYLSNPRTIYPIRIDPTIEINYSNNGSSGIQDVTINSNSSSSGSSSSLYVGSRQTYGTSRILMKFPGLNFNSIGSTNRIKKATVQIRDLMCESQELEVLCYIFNGATWSESTANWSNVSPDNYIRLQSSNKISYANGLKQSSNHWYKYDITDAVMAWRKGTYSQNKGIIFKVSAHAESFGAGISKTFASYNRTSYRPYLTIVYNGASAILLGVTNSGHDHTSCLTTIQSDIANCAYTSISKKTGSFTTATVRNYLDSNNNSLFVSRSHGVKSPAPQTYTGLWLNDTTPEVYLFNTDLPTSLNLSNLQLAMFIGCYTGAGGSTATNLPSTVVARGAETAVGFSQSIMCPKANQWTIAFFNLMNNGYTVQAACETLAAQTTYNGSGLGSFVICGNKNNFLH